ncbi:MAG: hypothetical protein AB1552_07885 [Nitrospirota bacterium]
MGRKQLRTGKYIYFFVACLMWAGLSGCAIEQGLRKEALHREQASEQLAAAKKMLEKGNYERAMEFGNAVLEIYPEMPLADEALFNLGLAAAHFRNPKKDYRKSRLFFERLLREYPASHLAEQARIWIGVLVVIERSKEVDVKIQEMKKELLR